MLSDRAWAEQRAQELRDQGITWVVVGSIVSHVYPYLPQYYVHWRRNNALA